jgi:hypothetical protein
LIGRIVKYFEGGLTYSDCVNMPIPELLRWAKIAKKLNNEEKKEISNAR